MYMEEARHAAASNQGVPMEEPKHHLLPPHHPRVEDEEEEEEEGEEEELFDSNNKRVKYQEAQDSHCSPPMVPLSVATTTTTARRGRGRPPGSGPRQLIAALGGWFACSAGGSFTPHVVIVAAGEDVATRIMSFSLKGPRGICILSANGAVSNVTLRLPGSSGGTFTYEGLFEILSLSGSFTFTKNEGVRSRTGGISISLAGPDGRVLGGGVAGLLLAASPIQVVVGSFMPNILKDSRRKLKPQLPAFSLNPVGADTPTTENPLLQASPDSEHVTPRYEVITCQGQQNAGKGTVHSGSAYILERTLPPSGHRHSPDINICLHGE